MSRLKIDAPSRCRALLNRLTDFLLDSPFKRRDPQGLNMIDAIMANNAAAATHSGIADGSTAAEDSAPNPRAPQP